jgi:hypothetical protein
MVPERVTTVGNRIIPVETPTARNLVGLPFNVENRGTSLKDKICFVSRATTSQSSLRGRYVA